MLTDSHNSKYQRNFVIRCHWVHEFRHSEAPCALVSEGRTSLQPSDMTAHSGPISRCGSVRVIFSYTAARPSKQRGILFTLARLVHVRHKWCWQKSAHCFSTKVETSPHGDNSVAVSGTTFPSHQVKWRPTSCIKKDIISAPAINAAHPKAVREALFRAARSLRWKERRRAAKWTAGRCEVSCRDAYEQRGWIWHPYYRNWEQVFPQWKTGINVQEAQKDTFYTKSWSYERVYWLEGVSLSTVTICIEALLLYTGYLVIQAETNFSLASKLTTTCSHLKFLFIFPLLVEPDTHPNTTFRTNLLNQTLATKLRHKRTAANSAYITSFDFNFAKIYIRCNTTDKYAELLCTKSFRAVTINYKDCFELTKHEVWGCS